MEFLKSTLMPILVRIFIGSAPTTGVGFSMEKLLAAVRVAAMTALAVAAMTFTQVIDSFDFGVLESLMSGFLTGLQAYMYLHWSDFLPKTPAPPAG